MHALLASEPDSLATLIEIRKFSPLHHRKFNPLEIKPMPKKVSPKLKGNPPQTKAERRAAKAEGNSEHKSKMESKKTKRRLENSDADEARALLAKEADESSRAFDARREAIDGRSVPDGHGGAMIDPDDPGQRQIVREAERRKREYLHEMQNAGRAPKEEILERFNAEIARERKTLTELQDALRRGGGASKLAGKLDRHMATYAGVRVVAHPIPNKEGDVRNLEKFKAAKAEKKIALADLKIADRIPDEAKRILFADIDDAARKGSQLFSIDGATAPDGSNRLEFRNVYHRDRSTGMQHEVPDLKAIVCALFTDRVKKFTAEKLTKHYAKHPGISAEDRAAQIAKLRAEILDLDWQIEAEVRALQAKGAPVWRPDDLSIWAVLGLRRVGKTPREVERAMWL